MQTDNETRERLVILSHAAGRSNHQHENHLASDLARVVQE